MSQHINFRHIAAARLARAKNELQSADDERLRFAALELRMAIEGVTYDRAMAYKAEIPPSEFGTWQPKKLLQVLLDIDPHADQTSSFRFREETALGAPAKHWQSLGTDTVFNIKSIRAHYDALGSFLHLPSIKQIEAGQIPDTTKLRKRCDAIVEELDGVLTSPVYNVTLGSFATLACLRCEKPIRKRIPIEATTVQARCLECGASYEVVRAETSGQVEWLTQTADFNCRGEGCTTVIQVWRDQVAPGTLFKCPTCTTEYRIELGAVPHLVPPPTIQSTSGPADG